MIVLAFISVNKSQRPVQLLTTWW